jgi:Enterobacterial TraT complement resistance protein
MASRPTSRSRSGRARAWSSPSGCSRTSARALPVLSSTETTDWKRYQTRVQSTASKANLEFEEAAPELTSGLTRSIAGIF